jgi:hypothetical protein
MNRTVTTVTTVSAKFQRFANNTPRHFASEESALRVLKKEVAKHGEPDAGMWMLVPRFDGRWTVVFLMNFDGRSGRDFGHVLHTMQFAVVDASVL